MKIGINKQYTCKRKKFLIALKQSNSLIEALNAVDIDYNIFLKWVDKYNWFKEAVIEYDRSLVFVIEAKLMEKINKGDLRSLELFLKYRDVFIKIQTENRIPIDKEYTFILKTGEDIPI